jgi:hypothetical protein
MKQVWIWKSLSFEESYFRTDFEYFPQYKIKLSDNTTHRADFLLRIWDKNDLSNKVEIVIECDGHDFHEKTKEQARKDRSRDRSLQDIGYFVLRFTGSEIFEDAEKCVTEAYIFGRKKLKLKENGSPVNTD